jgi:hypothetical protein
MAYGLKRIRISGHFEHHLPPNIIQPIFHSQVRKGATEVFQKPIDVKHLEEMLARVPKHP